jgi:hypothetical protein
VAASIRSIFFHSNDQPQGRGASPRPALEAYVGL